MDQEIQNIDNEEQYYSDLIISDESMVYFAETAKWAKFLSILGFIFSGLIVIIAIFAVTFFNEVFQKSNQNIPSGVGFGMTFIYLLMGLLYFFPTLFLFRF